MCSLWLRTGGFQMLFWSVIQARTAHSAAPQIANLLTLPIQQNKYSCSLGWSLRIKGSRTSLFCSLLSQELGLCYAKIYLLYIAGSTKYYLSTRNRLFSHSKYAACADQEKLLSASLAWWEHISVSVPSHSSFHSASKSLPRTVTLLLFYPCMNFIWRRIILSGGDSEWLPVKKYLFSKKSPSLETLIHME